MNKFKSCISVKQIRVDYIVKKFIKVCFYETMNHT